MAPFTPASHLPRNSVELSGALQHAGHTPTACFCVFWRHALDNASVGIMGHALRLRAISYDAVKHLVLCALEQRPPKLDLKNYPHLPVAEVALTRAADYQVLLQEVQ
jgi:hypothetical protein